MGSRGGANGVMPQHFGVSPYIECYKPKKGELFWNIDSFSDFMHFSNVFNKILKFREFSRLSRSGDNPMEYRAQYDEEMKN